jgi:uncharacterized membrane protein YbhN (UPF0104 family)
MRRAVFLILSAAVSLFFLWLALRDVPLADVLDSLRQARLTWVALSFVFIGLGLWARAVRWRGLLGNVIPQRRAVAIMGATFLLNQLPLRAGEVARSLLATRSGVSVVTAATSIALERILDTLLVVVFLFVALLRLPAADAVSGQSGIDNTLAIIIGGAALIIIIILIIMARFPQIISYTVRTLEKAFKPLKRLRLSDLVDQVLIGLQPLTHWRSGLHAVGWTLIAWFFSMLTFLSLQQALGIDNVDPLTSTLLTLSLASLSLILPVSIAAIGPFEAAVSVAGEAVGLSPVVSRALSFLYHGVTMLGYGLYGVISLMTLGVSLSEMMQAAEVEKPE